MSRFEEINGIMSDLNETRRDLYAALARARDLESNLAKMIKDRDYWKSRCYLAERRLKISKNS